MVFRFQKWDEEVKARLEILLSWSDFLIARGRAVQDYLPSETVKHLLQFSGSSTIILQELRKWWEEIEQVLRCALENYPETFSDYAIEICSFDEQSNEKTYISQIMITPTLVSSDESWEDYEALRNFIVKTGKTRFRMYLEPPEQIALQIRQEALWHRRKSVEDAILEGTFRTLPPGYIEQFAPDEVIPLPPQLEEEDITIIRRASPERQYNYFFRVSVFDEGFWVLWGRKKGWFWFSEGAQKILPLWPRREFADIYAQERGFKELHSRFIRRKQWLEEWLPMLLSGEYFIEIFPLPEREGFRLAIDVFEDEYAVAREACKKGLLPRLRIPGPWVAVVYGSM